MSLMLPSKQCGLAFYYSQFLGEEAGSTWKNSGAVKIQVRLRADQPPADQAGLLPWGQGESTRYPAAEGSEGQGAAALKSGVPSSSPSSATNLLGILG